MSAPKLFSPGPVMVKDNVRSALLHYDICHRSEEFEDMFADTQEKIRWLFRADDSYYPVIISGSGTSAVPSEASGSSGSPPCSGTERACC